MTLAVGAAKPKRLDFVAEGGVLTLQTSGQIVSRFGGKQSPQAH
jgi:hypothetical protein